MTSPFFAVASVVCLLSTGCQYETTKSSKGDEDAGTAEKDSQGGSTAPVAGAGGGGGKRSKDTAGESEEGTSGSGDEAGTTGPVIGTGGTTSPDNCADNCVGLQGVFELTATDSTYRNMLPWLFVSETEDGCTQAWVAEQWHDRVKASLTCLDDRLLLQVPGEGAPGGSETNTMYWYWWWHSFDFERNEDGSLATKGDAHYSYEWSEEDIGDQGEVDTSVFISSPQSDVQFRWVYPNRRPAALPWDGEARLESNRPYAGLNRGLDPLIEDVGSWTMEGERFVVSQLPANWDLLNGAVIPVSIGPTTLDEAGRPAPSDVPDYTVMDVGEAVTNVQFDTVPDAVWGMVELAGNDDYGYTPPSICDDNACLMICPGCDRTNGLAWRMDTRDATELQITFALAEDNSPTFGGNGLEVTATTDDGVVLGEPTESKDMEAKTFTLHFDLPTSNQVGIELGVSGSCHWGGPIQYVMSAVVR